jgi:hypothetical protein
MASYGVPTISTLNIQYLIKPSVQAECYLKTTPIVSSLRKQKKSPHRSSVNEGSG